MSVLPELKHYYKKFPKVELHVHLDSSFREETLREVARKHNLDLPYDDDKKFKDCVSLNAPTESLGHYLVPLIEVVRPLLSTSLDTLKRLAFEFVETSHEHNVLYTEARYPPFSLLVKGKKVDDVVKAVQEGLADGEKKFGVMTRGILYGNKGMPEEQIKELVDLADRYRDLGIVGIDICGDSKEANPFLPFIPYFQDAASRGINITVHAGESGQPAEFVKTAIIDLKATRVGHGYNAWDDSSVIDLIREKGIHLEGCPISSIFTNSNSMSVFKKFVDSNIPFSVNSDDPGLMRTTLSHDYQKVVETFGISRDYLSKIVRDAAKASFLPPNEKAKLLIKVDEELSKFHDCLDTNAN